MWVGNPKDKPITQSDWVWYNFTRALYWYYKGDEWAARSHLSTALGYVNGTYYP